MDRHTLSNDFEIHNYYQLDLPNFDVDDFGLGQMGERFNLFNDQDTIRLQPYVPELQQQQPQSEYSDEFVILPRSFLKQLEVPPCMLNSSVPYLGDCPYMKENEPKPLISRDQPQLDDNIFHQMLLFETENPGVRQSELERIFNVNRATYWKWKKKKSQPRIIHNC